MYISREYQCPSCTCRSICNGLTPFHVFGLNEDKDNRMESDGYGWSRIASDDYVMCPGCRNVFDIYRGDNGGSTVYERPALPPVSLGDKLRSFVGIEKDIECDMDDAMKDARFRVSPGIDREYHNKWEIITGGFELYEKAFRIKETRVPVRCSILLRYIWGIERMEENEKASYSASYNEALSEILEILENNIAYPEAYEENTLMILQPGDLGRDFDVEKQENDEYNAVKTATIVLLAAEFYRRKRMFDRAIAILDGYDFVTPYPYQKMAGAILDRSRKNIPELFYLETDYFKNKSLPLL